VPRKAAYLELETSPELEFEFYLATKLHMTVGQLRAGMTQNEFVQWAIYYQRLAQQMELQRLEAGERG
jgi:allophanate hydrolase subunit 2